MLKLNSGTVIMRTAALLVGIVFLCVTTLEAAPSPRLLDLQAFKSAITSIEKCENYINDNLGITVNLPIDAIQELLFMYNSYEQCFIIYGIIKSISPSYYSDSLANDESQRLGILEMLAQLGQNMIRDDLENSKRIRRNNMLDFGLSRGYSADLEAQQRIAYEHAKDPKGPGKRNVPSAVSNDDYFIVE